MKPKKMHISFSLLVSDFLLKEYTKHVIYGADVYAVAI